MKHSNQKTVNVYSDTHSKRSADPESPPPVVPNQNQASLNSSPQILQKDFAQYKRIYLLQLERAKQQKIQEQKRLAEKEKAAQEKIEAE